MSGCGLVRIFLCAVSLVEEFDIVRCAGIGCAEVEGCVGGVAECFMDATDLPKDFCIVGKCVCERFERGECTGIVSSRAAEIEFVDMRYGNGFTIGWKSGARSPVHDAGPDEQGMVAGIIE